MASYQQEPTVISQHPAPPIVARCSKVIAVLFDLDDTLIDTAAAKEKKREACIAVLKGSGAAATDEDARRYYQLFYEIVNRRSDEALQTVGLPENQLDAILTAYSSILPELLPGAKETLGALGERGYVRGCVTNGKPDVQRGKIEGLGLGSFPDGSSLLLRGSLLNFAVISGDVGCEKPDEAIYVAALHHVQQYCTAVILAEQVVFVGDRPSDWVGANKVGMISVQLLRNGAEAASVPEQEIPQQCQQPAYRITSLSDLLLVLPGTAALQESYAAAN